jgi:formate dehydrogenase gamma subunit
MNLTTHSPNYAVRTIKTIQRFTVGQRWEHMVLLLCVFVLLLTGLPQKYRTSGWSQELLSTPERLVIIQQIHHIAALILILEVIYHLGLAIILIALRKMNANIFPSTQDLKNAWDMTRYLIYLSNKKPNFGKYNFEQKITYWFIFFGIGIMAISGLILWFPEFFTRFLPGGIIPASKLTHSSEAIVMAVFVVIWHFYHVHFERLNLSIFTGWLSEDDMRAYHIDDYNNLIETNIDNNQISGEEEKGGTL